MQGKEDKNSEFDWFDRPESKALLWRLLYGVCAVTLLLEIVMIALGKRHSHFGAGGIDGWWFFYPLLGFIACSLMILAAKGLGSWLKRPESYYSDPEETSLPDDIDESLR